ncbi:MAG TPA: molybdopterin-guanine dinucleotide biosynthesis protein B [Coriobacteriia bacterium]
MSDHPNAVPVVSVVGAADSGKTTFLEKLIRELSGRGVRVATVKHYHHDYDTDVAGKDSWRHAQAGSMVAMVSSPSKLSVVERVQREATLAELAVIAFNAGSDVLLTEGYKREGVNRVEISRREAGSKLLTSADQLLALVTDMPEEAPAGVAVFDLDDAAGVADLVQSRFLAPRGGD